MTPNEPMKCELCKREPKNAKHFGVYCTSHNCAFKHTVVESVNIWNSLQTALIELQREAFKAGSDSQVMSADSESLFQRYLAERSAK